MYKLYDYLLDNYKTNEPIILYNVKVKGMSKNAVKLEMKKLQEEEKVAKFDRGVYYLPTDTPFGKSNITAFDVIKKKFLLDENNNVIGYITDMNFSNYLKLTTQRPAGYTVRTNKATKNYEEKNVGGFRTVIRKPRYPITNENYKYLQLLDLIEKSEYLVEYEFEPVFPDKIKEYMKENKLKTKELMSYCENYPVDIYKKLYERGILNESFK